MFSPARATGCKGSAPRSDPQRRPVVDHRLTTTPRNPTNPTDAKATAKLGALAARHDCASRTDSNA